MSKGKKVLTYIKTNGSALCVILSLTLFFFSLLINSSSSDLEHVARKTERKLERRMELLDRYIAKALESDQSQWLDLGDLPEDMVIYRYVYDTLQSWCNQFTINNDDIGNRLVFQRLSNYRLSLSSPLSKVTEEASFLNLGPKWYLIKSATDGVGCKVIAGLEIKNALIDNMHKSYNGVNPKLGLSSKFSILPINNNGGSPVHFHDKPVFKVISETSLNSPYLANSILRWFALLLITLAAVTYLWTHRSGKIYAAVIVMIMTVASIAYIWGLQMQESSSFFSPTIYADGPFLYSFGALVILNFAVFLYILCTYLVREAFIIDITRTQNKAGFVIYAALITALVFILAAYTHITLHSLIMNSNIYLELYMWSKVSLYTLCVYLSYGTLLLGLLMLLQMIVPAVEFFTGKKCDVFSAKSLLFFSAIFALYFTVMTGVLGFRKEQSRVMVWTNRIAIDRDLSLELLLRNVEDAVASDPFISTMSGMDRSNSMIINRLTENYLNRAFQNYDISVTLCRNGDTKCMERHNSRIRSGLQIAPGSRFVYTYDAYGHSAYIGTFFYYSVEKGVSRLFIEIEPKTNREDRGYYNMLGKYGKPLDVNIPEYYSYAKYLSYRIVSNKGNYAYPTVLDETLRQDIIEGTEVLRFKKFVHFINRISDEEIIIASRPVRGKLTYIITFSYLLLTIFALLMLFSSKKHSSNNFKKNYYRSRINAVLFLSLFITLITMAVLSVTFVFQRNENNIYKVMSDRINTIQSLFESQCRQIENYSEMDTQEFANIMEDIAKIAKVDITLYTPSGKVFRSTTPEVFEKLIIGLRINQDAYYNIKYKNYRFYIHPEKFGDQKYYSLYAPIFNSSGKIIAMVSAPFTDQSYDFKQEVMFHAAAIINIFIVLLVVTLLFSTTVVNMMFKPLIEIGQKMNSTDIHDLQYIIYKRNDEISTLVDAYNRMVHDLSESTKHLTQTERDKAWSEMARQVAHEIKNPLTPIKLEIQRLIRLKQKNDPSWEAKFDGIATIILEHIDILTDTANEFSTFAKLYSEDPVLIDLDATLRDQITIFDNRDDIKISYIGLSDARVLAPKPQLIRVFVNLLTNAIQAIDISRKEAADNPSGKTDKADGKAAKPGMILVCLRNSAKDGYYDIVFEDNGSGVKDENLSKLFTPNFTTKSGGTGLGLAICRNIIEKCNGEILYQRSFALKGACFTVRLPKNR